MLGLVAPVTAAVVALRSDRPCVEGSSGPAPRHVAERLGHAAPNQAGCHHRVHDDRPGHHGGLPARQWAALRCHRALRPPGRRSPSSPGPAPEPPASASRPSVASVHVRLRTIPSRTSPASAPCSVQGRRCRARHRRWPHPPAPAPHPSRRTHPTRRTLRTPPALRRNHRRNPSCLATTWYTFSGHLTGAIGSHESPPASGIRRLARSPNK